jgi:branched-chain amino acid transport system permease protein
MLLGAALPWYDAKLAHLNDPQWSKVIVGLLGLLVIVVSVLYVRNAERNRLGLLGALAFSISALVVELVTAYDLSRVSDKVGGASGVMQIGFPVALVGTIVAIAASAFALVRERPLGTRREARATTSYFLRKHRSISIILGMSLVTAILPAVVLLPGLSALSRQTVWIESFAGAGVFVLLALGLNVVVGMAGLLDLGYAAFFAIGSYAYAYSASSFTGLDTPFWLMLPIGALIAAVFGILLGAPTLRLRGDYLAIVTLGFGEIVPVVFNNSDKWTNGTNGIAGISRPDFPGAIFGATNAASYYVTMAVIITIVMILMYRLQDSRLGRSWQAIREDELAAASNGINTVTTKLLAFALGASTAGLAGVFNASKLVFVSPDQFLFSVSFTVLAMVVLGGIGNIWGVAVGAFILQLIQSTVLKQLNALFDTIHVPILSDIDFVQYQFLLYGLALVAMMLLRPEGLFPNRRRAAELHTQGEPGGADAEGPDPLGPLANAGGL